MGDPRRRPVGRRNSHWRDRAQGALLRKIFLDTPCKFLLLAALAFPCVPSFAQATPPSVDAEIAGLFEALEQSGCRFARNGQWYDAARASKHLERKLDYLRGKGSIESTEAFIELAATGSSRSGKPYLVRCGEADAEPSRAWFLRQLQALRSRRASEAPPKP